MDARGTSSDPWGGMTITSKKTGKSVTTDGWWIPFLGGSGNFYSDDVKNLAPLSAYSPANATPSASPGTTPPTTSPRSFQWSFPQYSQTWAFTPPAPSAFRLPPPFNPSGTTGATGGATSGASTRPPAYTPVAPPAPTVPTSRASTAPASAFSLPDLMGRYR